jgi:hypothetical protein
MADVRSFIEVGPKVKDRLRHAVEALIDVLDSLDVDPDFEDGGDDELTGDEEPRFGLCQRDASGPRLERPDRGSRRGRA